MDAAQIFRQTINTTQFDTTAGVGASPSQTAAAETGSAMGYGVTVDVDPMAELFDSMEELSMQFEEKESKSVSDRKLGETKLGEARSRRHAYFAAVAKWTKAFPDLPPESMISSMLKRLHNATEKPSARDLLRRLADMADDPSLTFAMLDCLEEGLGKGDVELLELIRQAKRLLENQKGAEMRAGINLADEINNRAASPEEIRDLRQMYRGEVLGFSTPQNCFRSLLATRGEGQLAEALEFLLSATSADMQATSPSTPPEELRRIMLDLQCVEVLRTVLEKMNALEARMQSQFGERCLLNGERMTGQVVDLTEQSFVSAALLGGFLKSCGLRTLLAQMDFMTQMTAVFRMLSPRMFDPENARFKLVDSAQEVLDGLIERVEDEEERSRSKGGGAEDDGDDENGEKGGGEER